MKTVALLTLSIFILVGCKTKKKAMEQNTPSRTEHIEEREGKPLPLDGAYSPNTLIIMVDTLVGKGPLMEAIKEYGATLKYDYSLIPGVAIRIPEGKTLQESIAYFKKVRGVVSVSKDRITRITDPVKPKLLDK